jgi:hypothetical protein
MHRAVLPALLSLLALLAPAVGRAEADTEHMFGFSEGTDIGEPFQPEGEIETVGRLGKSQGTYSALATTFNLKYPLATWFRVAPGIAFARYEIAGVPTFDDVNQFVFDHAQLEFRWRVLGRESNPVGLTVVATPFYGTVDPATGTPADSFGVQFIAAVDRELVPDRLFATVNLVYGLGRTRTRATGLTEDASQLGLSAAATVRLLPWLYLGGDLRYLRNYDGLGLSGLAGQAVYLGPTFYATLGKGVSLSGAWEPQVWGQSPDTPSSLDLATFERHQFKVRLSVDL